MSPTAPTTALNQARVSTVGRQVRACNVCRALKIKCRISDDGPPCERCRARGSKCYVEKSPHSSPEDSNKWRVEMMKQVAQLQTAVNVLLRTSELPPLSSYRSPAVATHESGNEAEVLATDVVEDSSLPAPITSPGAPQATNTNIYNLPIDSLYEVTRLPSLRNGDTPVDRREPFATDFIARGSISNAAAQQLFHRFKPRLDYFCYGIMCPHEDLDALRSSSALLTAAICAVSALHDPEGSGMFKVCHAEFLRLASAGMFSISYSPDDIRGLIVGAYWLANVSYTLIGHAVRVAARLNYHIAYFSVVNNTSIGKERADDIEKARLWYVLYVLDHHSSILYGRPALISATEEPHQQWETFIHANGDNEKDKRITSQVALHHITSKVKEIFGSYSTQGVPEHFLQQLRGYFSELDRWYMAWGNRMQRNPFIGWFPRDGAILHYHFARLHLCSYVFRGMSENSVSAASSNVREYASLAVSSATSVLELVVERDDMRTALAGMPIYFHGMITFAAVFLIKAAKTSFHGLATVDVSKSLSLVQTCMRELRAQSAAPQHLVYHLCNGLEQMMAHSMPTSAEGSAMATPRMTEGTTAGPTTSPEFDVSSSMASIDSMFMANPFDLIQYPADGQAESGMGNGFDWESQFGL